MGFSIHLPECGDVGARFPSKGPHLVCRFTEVDLTAVRRSAGAAENGGWLGGRVATNGIEIPDADHAVDPSGGEPAAVSTEGVSLDFAFVSMKSDDVAEGVVRGERKQVDAILGIVEDEPASIGADGIGVFEGAGILNDGSDCGDQAL